MFTTGDHDPQIPPESQTAHDEAVEAGKLTYRDPVGGGVVVTRLNLLHQGQCCGVGWRHCPYTADQQRAAGREVVRAAS